MNVIRGIVTLLLTGALLTPVSANDVFLDMAVHYGQNVVNTLSHDIHSAGIRSTARRRRSGKRVSRSPQTAQVSPAKRQTGQTGQTTQRHSLTFGSSPEVSKVVIDRVVETLAGSLAPGKSEADLRKLLESGRLQRKFADMLKEQGYSDRNLADVITAQLIVSWQIATQTPYYDSSTFKVVRDGMHSALETQDWVGQLSSEQKQQAAETIGLGTMLILGRYEHALETDNAKEKQTASQDAADFVEGFAGVDLRTLKLTSHGFSPL